MKKKSVSQAKPKGDKYSGFESVMNSLQSGHHDIRTHSGIFAAMGSRKKRKKEQIW
jgi:hypothetical protein